MSRPLDGILVVALEQAVAAPFASSRLADAGARVIKLERKDGDFARRYDTLVERQSAYYVWLNRGKESVIVDIKDADDRALLERLIAQADVFIQNLKPGTTERLGLGSQTLRERHPRLITCDITGFGATGDYADLKAYDLIVQAEVGLCAITGTAPGPARVGVSVCVIGAGMAALAAIREALYARERTGEGARLEISLFDVTADWMNVPMLQLLYGGRETQRAGVSHPSLSPYGAYRCADGRQVIFSVQNNREWVSLCTHMLKRPELATDRRFTDNMDRLAHRGDVDALVAAALAELTALEAMSELEAAGRAYGRLNDLATASRHPHLRRAAAATPNGQVDIVAPPVRRDGVAPVLGAIAALGAHSVSVRAEFAGPAGQDA